MFTFSCACSASSDCAHAFHMAYKKTLDFAIQRIESRFEARISKIKIRMRKGEKRLTKEIRTLKKELQNERLNNWKTTERFSPKLADAKYPKDDLSSTYQKPDTKWSKEVEKVNNSIGGMTNKKTLKYVNKKQLNNERTHVIVENKLIPGKLADHLPSKSDEEYKAIIENNDTGNSE